MKKTIPYLLILILSVFLSGCGSEPVNLSVIECSEDLSPVMGCEILPEGKLKCTNPPEIVQRVLPNIQIIIVDGAKKIYNSLKTPEFQKIVSALLIMYLVMYGAWVAAGLTQLELGDVVNRLFRIAILGFLLSEQGTTFYFEIMEKLWIIAPDEILNILISPVLDTKDFISDKNITSHQNILEEIFKVIEGGKDVKMDSTGKSGIVGLPFMMLDMVFATIFSERSIAFYVALWTHGWAGKALFALVTFTLFVFTWTVCKAIFDYVKALLFRTVLIGIGYLFILLTLFKKTREKFFGAWILRLLTYTFQPIFLFTFLGIITVLINVMFLDLTEGQFGANEERQPSSTGMLMTKNRACYHKYEALGFIDTYAWRFSKHDEAKTVLKPYVDPNKGWAEVPFMVFLFTGVIWMCYKSMEAAKMIPELMFAFAPISVESGVGASNLTGMARQLGHSAIGFGADTARAINPFERQAMADDYYHAHNAKEQGAGILGQLRAGAGGFARGKWERKGKIMDRQRTSWKNYFSNNQNS